MIATCEDAFSVHSNQGEEEEVVVKKTLGAMLAAILTLAVSAGFPPHSEAQSKKVVVQLAWVVGGLHAGFFVAKEKASTHRKAWT